MTELLIYALKLEKMKAFPSVPVELTFREFQNSVPARLEGVNKKAAFDSSALHFDEYAKV